MAINYNIPISSIFLVLTNNCNCKCKYCFESHHKDFMAYQVAKDAADYVIKNAEINKSIPSIIFFGGEPLLCWDSIIVPLTKYIRNEYQKPFSLSITTNGILLTEEKLKFMKKNNISLLFSVDGDKETQDFNRPLKNGESSFEKIKDIIPIIPKYFPNTTFRATIIPETVSHLYENIQFAISNGYNNFFIIPNNFQEWNEKDKEILKKEFRKYSNYFINCYKNNSEPIKFLTLQESFIKIQIINQAIASQSFRNEKVCGIQSKCGLACRNIATVGIKGDLFGCQELSCEINNNKENFFYIGNIYTGIDTEKRKKLIKSYDAKNFKAQKCKTCKLNRICNGGCAANNFLYSGDINTPPDIYCWWHQLLLDEAIYICNSFNNNIPPSFLQYWERIHDYGRF